MGLALNLEEDIVGAIVLGDYTDIKEGDEVRSTGRIIEVPVGDALIGRVVDPLGQPIDGRGPVNTDKARPIERIAPNVVVRESVNTSVHTGIKAIDAMVPIGRGQRELIIGDRFTGKTTICLDAIIAQKNTNVVCIYVAIGQQASKSRAGRRHPRRKRRHGAHHRRRGQRLRRRGPPVPRTLRRLRNG